MGFPCLQSASGSLLSYCVPLDNILAIKQQAEVVREERGLQRDNAWMLQA